MKSRQRPSGSTRGLHRRVPHNFVQLMSNAEPGRARRSSRVQSTIQILRGVLPSTLIPKYVCRVVSRALGDIKGQGASPFLM
jgi:hypothetical protein